MFFGSFLFTTCMVVQHVSGAFKSCKELQLILPEYENQDGIYTLRTSEGEEYQTFCDMTTDGGGWTLIASVHENNLNGKCTAGDRWSSQQGNRHKLPAGDRNWINRNTFGTVESATDDDYKNPGYYDIEAVSLGVWHVPNSSPMEKWKDSAILRYRTGCSKFEQEGGNLFNIFERYPVQHGEGQCFIDNGPSVAIKYEFGDEDTIKGFYGATTREEFETGFITFRAINKERAAFAICSGTKPKESKCKVENYCIGGGGYIPMATPKCGDFSAFDQVIEGSDVKASPEITEAAVLLFYR